jgi:hypothetical protein
MRPSSLKLRVLLVAGCFYFCTLLPAVTFAGEVSRPNYLPATYSIDSCSVTATDGSVGRQGCFVPRGGIKAPPFWIETEADVESFVDKATKKGTFQASHVAVLESHLFQESTVKKLNDTGKLSAIIVSWREGGSPPPTFINGETSAWNPKATGFNLQNLGMPIFVVRDAVLINELSKAAEWNLDQNPSGGNSGFVVDIDDYSGPLNLDVRLCKWYNDFQIQRCEPVEGLSVWASMFTNVGEPSADRGKIVVATGIDSTSLFHSIAPGANAGSSGYITVLAALKALSEIPSSAKKAIKRDVVATLFGSEVQGLRTSKSFVNALVDGCSSAAVVNDDAMSNGPICNVSAASMEQRWGDSVPRGYVAPLEMFDLKKNIEYLVSVDQVGRASDAAMHVFGSSSDSPPPVAEVLSARGSKIVGASGMKIRPGKVPPKAQLSSPFPPSPAEAFLEKALVTKERTVVFTGYESTYTNDYYHSMFDGIDNVNRNDMIKFSNTLARTLYVLATATDLEDKLALETAADSLPSIGLVVDEAFVNELINCTLVSWSCPLGKKFVDGGSLSTTKYSNGLKSSYVPFAREFLSKITYRGDFGSLDSCGKECKDCVAEKCLRNSTAWYWGVERPAGDSPSAYMAPTPFQPYRSVKIYRQDTSSYEWCLFIASCVLAFVWQKLGQLLVATKVKEF